MAPELSSLSSASYQSPSSMQAPIMKRGSSSPSPGSMGSRGSTLTTTPTYQ